MFEQAMLSTGPAAKRVWTTCAGMSAEALLVCLAMLSPLVFPQALPNARAILVNFLPLVPPPPPGPAPSSRPAVAAAVRPGPKGFVEPSFVPPKAAIVVDPPPAAPDAAIGIGVPGGIAGGVENGVPGGVLASILTSATRALPPVHPPPLTPTPAADKPAVIPRVREGGVVHLGNPVFRPDPQYPALARQARISGIVVLEAVIGTDGRVRALKVLSGHPLLVHAAVDAVRTWIYKPTTLNGDPVEVIAPITVTFTLN